MKTAIFIRSYNKDFEWLSYCLRSIQKFATGFSEIVIAVPDGHQHALSHLTAERVIPVHDAQPGYLGQQVTKLTADIHCPDADFILHVDSDCVFTKPITPASFMHHKKPRWLTSPWEECMDAKKAWFHVMAKLFLECPPCEFMRKVTLLVPRFAYQAFREFVHEQTGKTMEAYVMNQPNREFSEYNCLGFYLWLFHRDKIEWHDVSKRGVPDIGEIQHWSWGGIKPEIKDRFESLLA